MDLSRSGLSTLAYLGLAGTAVAAVLWYLFPELGGWPLVIALAPWLIRFVIAGHLPARTPFDLPLLIFLITAGVSVWAAYDRETAWAKFWIVVGGILLYYALANAILANPETMPRRLAWVLAFLGVAVALYFLATNDWNEHPGKIAGLATIGRGLQAGLPALPGHRLHPNVVGGILAVLVPFGVAAVLDLRRAEAKGNRLVKMATGLLLLAVILFGLLMSSSRGAWLGLAGAIVLALWWFLAGSLTRSQPAWHVWLFLAGLAVQAIALTPLARSQLERLDSTPLASPQNVGVSDSCGSADQLPCEPTDLGAADSGRLELYRNSLILVSDYALSGAGLGGFNMLYSTYSFLIHVEYSFHSHNLFLDVAIEQGLFALLALLGTWAFVAKQMFRGSGLGVWQAAAAIAIIVIALHGLLDDALYGSRALLLLFIPLAFFVGEAKTAAAQTAGAPVLWFSRHRFQIVAVGLLGLATIIWYRSLLSLWYSNLAAVEQSQVELGSYTWPEWPLQDELRRQLDISRAVEHYEHALAFNGRNPSANRRLGQIELSLGEYEDALNHLTAAYELTPWDNATRQLLGEAYLVNGRLAEGKELWSTVEAMRKQLEIRAYWYEHIGDRQRLSWIQSSLTP